MRATAPPVVRRRALKKALRVAAGPRAPLEPTPPSAPLKLAIRGCSGPATSTTTADECRLRRRTAAARCSRSSPPSRAASRASKPGKRKRGVDIAAFGGSRLLAPGVVDASRRFEVLGLAPGGAEPASAIVYSRCRAFAGRSRFRSALGAVRESQVNAIRANSRGVETRLFKLAMQSELASQRPTRRCQPNDTTPTTRHWARPWTSKATAQCPPENGRLDGYPKTDIGHAQDARPTTRPCAGPSDRPTPHRRTVCRRLRTRSPDRRRDREPDQPTVQPPERPSDLPSDRLTSRPSDLPTPESARPSGNPTARASGRPTVPRRSLAQLKESSP